MAPNPINSQGLVTSMAPNPINFYCLVTLASGRLRASSDPEPWTHRCCDPVDIDGRDVDVEEVVRVACTSRFGQKVG